MQRAQLQHPMNWILVLFAGFFFLLLFLSIINNVSRTAETRDEIVTSSQITNTLEQTRAAPGTEYELFLRELQTSCSDTFSLELSGQITPLRGHPIFAQESLSGQTIMFSEWLRINKPITTITYLYTQDTTFYVSDDLDTSTKNYFIEKLSNIRSFTQDDLPSSFSGTKTVAIFDSSLPEALSEVTLQAGQDFRAINISGSPDRGLVTINGETSEYPSKELLLAAILSPNKQTYECGVQLAQERTRFTATLLLNRTHQLNSTISVPLCTPHYEEAINVFEDLQTIDLTQQDSIINTHIRLRNLNTRLAANSCPEV